VEVEFARYFAVICLQRFQLGQSAKSIVMAIVFGRVKHHTMLQLGLELSVTIEFDWMLFVRFSAIKVR